jgi:RNA polymerase sigma-B factor
MSTGTDQELVELVRSLPSDDPRRQAAYETLIGRYQSIVRSCVHRYRDSPEPVEDLMQVGYLGLLKAILNFDPAVGQSLAAFAQPTVSGEIKRHFRDRRWQIRVRRPVQELRLRIRSAAAELTQQLARVPTAGELADWLEVTEAQVREAQQADQAFQASSLDAPAGEDHTQSLGEMIGADDPGLERAVDMEAVRTHWGELPRRQQQLLLMRYYGNMTQAQIGDKLGISQMHVSRLERRALNYIRDCLTQTRPVTAPAAAGGEPATSAPATGAVPGQQGPELPGMAEQLEDRSA